MEGRYHYELANAAGVSTKTFARWLKNDTEKLVELGCAPRSHLLTPAAVEYICQKYVIQLN